MDDHGTAAIRVLVEHGRGKVGMEERHVHQEGLEFGVLSGSLDSFVTVYEAARPPYVLLRCLDARREELAGDGASVRISTRMKWSGPGWHWCDVILDGTVPVETVLSLVDASYDLVVAQLKDREKEVLSLLARRLPARALLAELIQRHGLERRAAEIEGMLLPSLRLVTSAVEEAKLEVGASKIGGHPDLPESAEWPQFEGRPLSFLAQINLGEISAEERLGELPASGVLQIFSAYGWQVEGAVDPEAVEEEPRAGRTRVLYHETGTALRRRETPARTTEYRAARVAFHGTLCLPTSLEEPVVRTLHLDRDEGRQFDAVSDAFRYLTI